MRNRAIVSTAGTWLRYFFLAIAIACLGVYGFSSLKRVLYQARESREFDLVPDRGAAAVTSSDGGVAPVGRVEHASRMPTGLIGRLTVPRLHLSAMVLEGIGGRILQVAVGHIPATPLPGQPGNVGVAGHRDTFFRALKDLRHNDEIEFSTLSGDYKYVVESLMIVEPDNVGVLAPSPGNVLTLVTCYPFSYVGSAPKRFIARARQVSPRTATPK